MSAKNHEDERIVGLLRETALKKPAVVWAVVVVALLLMGYLTIRARRITVEACAVKVSVDLEPIR